MSVRVFVVKQATAYEMRISDWISDVCSSDLIVDLATLTGAMVISLGHEYAGVFSNDDKLAEQLTAAGTATGDLLWRFPLGEAYDKQIESQIADMKNMRSEEHTSELQSLMRISYAVFCLKKKIIQCVKSQYKIIRILYQTHLTYTLYYTVRTLK